MIESLLDRIQRLEQQDSGGEVSCTPAEAWALVLGGLAAGDHARLTAMDDSQLTKFLFEEQEGDDLWDLIERLFREHAA